MWKMLWSPPAFLEIVVYDTYCYHHLPANHSHCQRCRHHSGGGGGGIRERAGIEGGEGGKGGDAGISSCSYFIMDNDKIIGKTTDMMMSPPPEHLSTLNCSG
jgi:hypothetical protein